MRRKLLNEHKAWKAYKNWQKKNIDKIREGQEITSLGEFQIIYNECGRRITNVKQEVMYQTSKTTFNTFNSRYFAITGKNIEKRERSLSTRELAAKIVDDINAYREEQIKKYMTENNLSYGAALNKARIDVSKYYFGS